MCCLPVHMTRLDSNAPGSSLECAAMVTRCGSPLLKVLNACLDGCRGSGQALHQVHHNVDDMLLVTPDDIVVAFRGLWKRLPTFLHSSKCQHAHKSGHSLQTPHSESAEGTTC